MRFPEGLSNESQNEAPDGVTPSQENSEEVRCEKEIHLRTIEKEFVDAGRLTTANHEASRLRAVGGDDCEYVEQEDACMQVAAAYRAELCATYSAARNIP